MGSGATVGKKYAPWPVEPGGMVVSGAVAGRDAQGDGQDQFHRPAKGVNWSLPNSKSTSRSRVFKTGVVSASYGIIMPFTQRDGQVFFTSLQIFA
jgi:hypothetical protein